MAICPTMNVIKVKNMILKSYYKKINFLFANFYDNWNNQTTVKTVCFYVLFIVIVLVKLKYTAGKLRQWTTAYCLGVSLHAIHWSLF